MPATSHDAHFVRKVKFRQFLLDSLPGMFPKGWLFDVLITKMTFIFPDDAGFKPRCKITKFRFGI